MMPNFPPSERSALVALAAGASEWQRGGQDANSCPPSHSRPAGWNPPATGAGATRGRDVATADMLRTPTFWALWAAYALGTTAGTMVIISPWLLHRRDDSWSDPLAFRPERFLDAGAGRSGYLPFGQGPRLCIGREFALGEMVVVLSRLLPAHRVGLPEGWSRPAAQAQVAVHPRGGMPLVVDRLDRSSG